MLNSYISNIQNLLQLPGSPTTLYSTANITLWANIARGQLAGESESIRVIGTISTVVGQRAYPFSSINIGTSSATGVQGIINIATIQYNVAQGQQWIAPRNWPWFQLYHLNNPVPVDGPPVVWAQYGQGSSGLGSITGQGTGTMASGSFYIDPPPDQIYQLNCDCVCYPIALAADTDVESLPYLWTDAVPFFAAWYALLSSQTSARTAEADKMFEKYQTFVERARMFSNPSVNRYIYQQAKDPAQLAKFGLSPAKGAA